MYYDMRIGHILFDLHTQQGATDGVRGGACLIPARV